MDRSISVRTPESIAFSYELAGLGSRFLAVAVDMLVQGAILTGILFALLYIAAHVPDSRKPAPSVGDSVGWAILIVIVFLVFFGYFVVFEGLWGGQTPGKKLLGIRVVRDGGYALDAGGSFIRNLIRIGEFALGFYAVSAVATLLSPENKRLGDMAAGTIVVREDRAQRLATILDRAGEDSPPIAMLTPDEHAIIARFIARRGGMDAYHRRNLASQIADRVRKRVPSDLQHLDDEDLLERINS